MTTLTTYTIYEYLKSKFPDLESVLRNGNIDKNAEKSIGVFKGSDTRATGNLAIGGVECTVIRTLPINIHIRWTSNQREHDNKAVELYNALLMEKPNFFVGDVKIASIMLLDSCPNIIGRDEKNVCESVIRANVYYYNN